MRISKRYINSSLVASSVITVNLPQISFTISLILLATVLSEVEADEIVLKAGGRDKEVQNDTCAEIQTQAEVSVTLNEGVTLSPEDFDKLHVKKIKNALIYPDLNRKCAVQVCGFTSFGERTNDSFFGSDNDYADCLLFTEERLAYDPFFNDEYNVSSIGCGCYKGQQECATQTCASRAESLHQTWKDDDCAILYQENGCNACYLNPIQLSYGQIYTTDNSHHVLSMVVKDKCEVHFYSPALKKIYRFANLPQPIIYGSGPTENKVGSAYQSDPEYFQCVCDVKPPTSSPETPQPHKSAGIFATIGYVIGSVGVFFVVVLVCTVIVMLKNGKWRLVNADSVRRESNETIMTDSLSSVEATDNQSQDTGDDGEVEYIDIDGPMPFFGDGDDQILHVPFNSAFQTSPQLFELHEILDSGNFGLVCEGTLKVAIKTIKNLIDLEDRRVCIQSLQQEIKILSDLGCHENVVRLLGAHVGDYRNGEIYLIIEFCEKGSLESYLASTVKPRVQEILCRRTLERMQRNRETTDRDYDDGYPEQRPSPSSMYSSDWENDNENDLEKLDPATLTQLYKWCSEITCGMMYIQSKNIVHVDLASRNVMLNSKLVAKIGDFGLSKKVYIKNYASSKKDSLPIRWVAPESLTKKRCTSKSDVWSFGVTAWEIFNLGKVPYEDLDCAQVVASIIEGGRLDCPQYAPEDIYSILKECWSQCPEERPSFERLANDFDSKMLDLLSPLREDTDL